MISIGIIVFASFKLYSINNEYEKEESYYEEIAESFIIKKEFETDQDVIDGIKIDEELDSTEKVEKVDIGIDVDFQSLQEQYTDVVAWIYCKDTQINYPVVQSKDNEYYLRKTIDGKYSYGGSIFMDFTNSPDFSDSNTILYGHNMKNNSMFGLVPDYINGDMYNKHPVWYILTDSGNYQVDFIGGMPVKMDSVVYENNPLKVAEYISRNTVMGTKFSQEIVKGDKIVTLSTCVYNKDNYRYVLVGLLTSVG